MGDSYVSQREFDEYKEHQRELRETDRRELARLRTALEGHEEQHEDDLKAAIESRNATWTRRIAAVGAGAAVIAAWVTVIELWHSTGR